METTLDYLKKFVEQVGQNGVESTGAQVVQYNGQLYNVIGSSNDPHINNKSWVGLLQAYNLGGPCNVVDVPHDTHPQFNVGGHMTPNQDGSVQIGGICYLMPLCAWHNNSARNRVAFTLVSNKILMLTGYMKSDLALTFIARMPVGQPYSIIYPAKGGWHTEGLAANPLLESQSVQLSQAESAGLPDQHILLRQEEKDGRIRFYLESSQL